MIKTGVYTFLVAPLMGVAAYAAFYVAPTEATMGLVQRIFYLQRAKRHDFTAGISDFVRWVRLLHFDKKPKWDWVAVSSAEVGIGLHGRLADGADLAKRRGACGGHGMHA